jgi:hypothetical protein
MTKPREASTFEDAALVVARDFGPAEAGKIVDRGAVSIRNWSDPDRDGRPSLHQALRLDVEHLKRFGTAPFYDAYTALLRERAPAETHGRIVGDLATEAMDVPIDAGRLIALLRQARALDSPRGAKLSAGEKAALQKEIKRIRDDIADVEAALKKS